VGQGLGAHERFDRGRSQFPAPAVGLQVGLEILPKARVRVPVKQGLPHTRNQSHGIAHYPFEDEVDPVLHCPESVAHSSSRVATAAERVVEDTRPRRQVERRFRRGQLVDPLLHTRPIRCAQGV
jgi:hypothetical protein